MRTRRVFYLLGFAALVASCSSSDSPTTTCNPNSTQAVDGQCESRITCGAGTQLVNYTCAPAEGEICGDGTEQDAEGRCVPSDTACSGGTRLVDGRCVINGETACGAGTVLDGDQCILEVELSCGPGTVATEQEDSTTVCELVCTDGQIFDQGTSGCVDQCAVGTTYDEGTNTCAPTCADDQFFVTETGGCVDVPACLRNVEQVGADCVGWPFNELSLETICARRAFNICDAEEACGCGSIPLSQRMQYLSSLINPNIRNGGGEVGGVDGGRGIFLPVNFGSYFSGDYASCVGAEYFFCELGGNVAASRDLVLLDQATVNTEVLTELDENYALAEGTCTRPAGWEYFPLDLFAQLIDGAVARDGACIDARSCTESDFCDFDIVPEADEPPTFRSGTCLPRIVAGQPCDVDFSGTRATCGPNLVCRPNADADDQLQCQAPAGVNQTCRDHSECQEGFRCLEANLQAHLEEVFDGDADPLPVLVTPTCQNPEAGNYPFVSGGKCFTASFLYSGYSDVFQNEDLCPPALWCDDAEFDNGGDGNFFDGVGECVAAAGVGDDCLWCDEAEQQNIFASLTVPNFQAPFSTCGGTSLACTIDRTDGIDQSCATEVSVCPIHEFDALVEGAGFCMVEADCSNDEDEDVDRFVDCDDFDCADDAACPEICDNGVDEATDADDFADCRDPQCFGEACSEETDALCGDGVDNDLDGVSDCDDDGCEGTVPCTPA